MRDQLRWAADWRRPRLRGKRGASSHHLVSAYPLAFTVSPDQPALPFRAHKRALTMWVNLAINLVGPAGILSRSQMIIREWRGRAALANAAGYPIHFRSSVVPELKRVPGFLGAHLCHRRVDDKIEFLVLTRWQSMDAIRGFAGSNVGTAVVEPGAVATLVDFDKTVQHYEVIEDV